MTQEEGNRNMQKDGTLIEDAEKEHLCIHAPGSIKLRMMTTLFDKEVHISFTPR